jgi:SAM-dependent methyltransferase
VPPVADHCCACGSGPLRLHLRVAGAVPPEGLIPTTDRYGTAMADIVRCATCGHGQLARLPPEADLAAMYGDTESDALADEEAGERLTARGLLEQVEAIRTPGALLEIGPWLGYLLAEARERGWAPVIGVEPSRFAAAAARERLGLDVRTGDVMTADLPEGRFRAAVLADVIEHLRDPAAALHRIAGVLEPDGVLALTIPDAGSRVARVLGRRWWSVLPTHVQYFTRTSVRRLLDRCGYEVVAIRTAPKAFTVRYYLARVGGYSPALARLVVGAAAAAGVADRLWAPDFRDRMLVLAQSRRSTHRPWSGS